MRFPFRRPSGPVPWRKAKEPEFKVPEGSVADVYINAHEYNRQVRRRVGYRRPIGLLGTQHEGLEIAQDPYVPRYARRHLKALAERTPRTRRNRRSRARIMRIAANMQLLKGESRG